MTIRENIRIKNKTKQVRRETSFKFESANAVSVSTDPIANTEVWEDKSFLLADEEEYVRQTYKGGTGALPRGEVIIRKPR
jgi:hypothetical protein